MKIDAVVFTQSDNNNNPSGMSLEIEEIKQNTHNYETKTKSLIVFSERYTEKLKVYENEIDFLGQQNDAVGLTKMFESTKDKIPLAVGKYSHIRRFIGSVYAYLNKDEVIRNRSLLALGDEVFKELWQTTSGNTSDAIFNLFIPGKIKSSVKTSEKQLEPDEDDLCQMLPPMAVSPDIEDAYIGESRDTKFIRQLIIRASQNQRPVLVLGDSGTGKDVIARQIHHHSDRSAKPFISINCGAIPSELFESELFGHTKGAFSGATYDKTGLWEAADGGTLFLDEIGDLSLHHQVKILRALQDGSGRRVGSVKNNKLNARVIAATNRHLYKMVTQGQFREDLYYRLRLGMLIYTSPLRDRREDIPLMTLSFWEKINPENDHRPQLSKEILSRLMDYQWPGNVREIKSILNSLYSFFYEEDLLTVKHLEAILAYEGQDTIKPSEASDVPTKTKMLSNKIKTMRQLIRVDELIEAIINDMTRFTSSHNINLNHNIDSDSLLFFQSNLKNRIDELDALCLYPLRFGSSVMFDEINLLRSRLLYFYGILGHDFQKACNFWQEDTKVVLKNTKNKISQIIGDLMV